MSDTALPDTSPAPGGTIVHATITVPALLRHGVELADKRAGEDVWERQARTLDELGYEIVPKGRGVRARLIEVLELGERGGGGDWTWDDIVAYTAKAKGSLAMTNETVRRRTAQLAEALGHPDPAAATWPEVVRLVTAARDQLADADARRTLGGRARPVTPGWAGGTLPPPPSATDPAAPPHHRDGMQTSRPATPGADRA